MTRRRSRCALLAVFFLAAVIRMSALSQQSLWSDEVLTIDVSRRPWRDIPSALEREESAKPPLYYALMHEWLRGRDGEAWARLPSALFGAVTCVVAALIGAELLGAPVGWGLGLLLAVSPFHVWYSQEARMYALFGLLGSAALALHLRFLTTRRTRDAAAYAVVATLACYTFTYGFFLLGFAVIASLLYRPRLSRGPLGVIVAANALAFAAFLPWLLRMVSAAESGRSLQFHKGPAAEALAYTLFSLGFGTTLGPSTDSLRRLGRRALTAIPVDGAVLVGGALLLVALTAIGLIELWQANRNAFWWSAVGLGVFWGGPALVSAVNSGITYNPRYAILAVLPLLLAVLAALAKTRHGSAWLKALTALLLLGLLASLANHFLDPRYARDDLRSAVAFLEARQARTPEIVVCAEYLTGVVRYYYHGSATITGITLPAGPGAEGRLASVRRRLRTRSRSRSSTPGPTTAIPTGSCPDG